MVLELAEDLQSTPETRAANLSRGTHVAAEKIAASVAKASEGSYPVERSHERALSTERP